MYQKIPLRPRLRPLEMISVGPKDKMLVALCDPEGFGRPVVLSCGAAVLAMLMDGNRTLSEIQTAFNSQTRTAAAINDLEVIIRQLDDAYLLADERFEQYRREQIDGYLSNSIRPASHAGGAYEKDPDMLKKQLSDLFTCDGGPRAVDYTANHAARRLCGVVSPHIDLHRGGTAFAWAYKQIAEHSNAEVFVIFGTAHHPMEELFCVSRKDFDTPLGVVRTDRRFIDRLAEHLGGSVAGQQVDLFKDELAHRQEHSIEFQTVFLQYILGGRREFRIVPVLVGSFHDFLSNGTTPELSPEVQAFVAAVRSAADDHPGTVCYISGADFAHIGQRFGDRSLLDDQRLAEQAEDDRKLLEAVRRCDSVGFFSHVAGQADCNRICGLSPTYTMLEVIGQCRGELLKYDQAVEPDRTACVSFAGMAFYK